MDQVTTSWPATLPVANIEGYTIKPGDPIARTEMESGAARQRRRFIDVPSEITVTWEMTNWQTAIFEGWHKWQAREGAAWFNIDLKAGMGFTPHIARFQGQYSSAPIRRGTAWRITAKLEVRERPVLSEGATAIVIQEDVTGLMAAINALHVYTHVTMPNIDI